MHPNNLSPLLNEQQISELDRFEVVNVSCEDPQRIIHLQWASCSVVVSKSSKQIGIRLIWANRTGREVLGIKDSDQSTDKA